MTPKLGSSTTQPAVVLSFEPLDRRYSSYDYLMEYKMQGMNFGIQSLGKSIHLWAMSSYKET